MNKPSFFIVGAPKCGTTAMYEYLRQHPDIYMPTAKEIHFFGNDLHFTCPQISEKQYLVHFKAAGNAKHIGEASVWYLFSQHAAEEIKAFSSDPRIIIMLRNPVDMLYSIHSQFLYNGNEDVEDFQQALNLEKQRKNGCYIPPTNHFIEGLFYRKTALYAEQVQRYFDVIGRKNVHIIIFDDFIKDTATVYQNVLRFLGSCNDFTPEFKIINPNKVVRSVRLRNLMRSTRNSPIASRLSPLIIRLAQRTVKHSLKKWNTKYVTRPSLDPELRARMTQEFIPEIDKLSVLLARDLSHWYA